LDDNETIGSMPQVQINNSASAAVVKHHGSSGDLALVAKVKGIMLNPKLGFFTNFREATWDNVGHLYDKVPIFYANAKEVASAFASDKYEQAEAFAWDMYESAFWSEKGTWARQIADELGAWFTKTRASAYERLQYFTACAVRWVSENPKTAAGIAVVTTALGAITYYWYHSKQRAKENERELSEEAASKEEEKVLEALSEPNFKLKNVADSLLLSVQSAFLNAGKTDIHPNRPCTFRKTKPMPLQEAHEISATLLKFLYLQHELVASPVLGNSIGDQVLYTLQGMSFDKAATIYPLLVPLEATCNGTTTELAWNDTDALIKQFQQFKLPIPEDAPIIEELAESDDELIKQLKQIKFPIPDTTGQI